MNEGSRSGAACLIPTNLAAVAFVFSFSVISGQSQAAPQTFNTALPVAKGEFVVRGQFLYRNINGDPEPTRRHVEVLGGVYVLAYGVSGRLTVFGALPFLKKKLEITRPDGERVTRETTGIADTRLFGRYTLFQKDMRGEGFRIAAFGGIEMPTGDDSDMDSFGQLPSTLQLGSGSWDPFVGLVTTYQTREYQIDGQAGHKANTEANGFEFGDEIRFDASVQYRLWPPELESGIQGFLYAGLEGNLVYRDKDRSGGVDDPDSGGTSFFLSPSLQYVTRRWVLEAVVQVPLTQDLNGVALEDDITVRAGFRANF